MIIKPVKIKSGLIINRSLSYLVMYLSDVLGDVTHYQTSSTGIDNICVVIHQHSDVIVDVMTYNYILRSANPS